MTLDGKQPALGSKNGALSLATSPGETSCSVTGAMTLLARAEIVVGHLGGRLLVARPKKAWGMIAFVDA